MLGELIHAQVRAAIELPVPRATMGSPGRGREWTSALVPRYQRRVGEINEAVIATYLAGGNQRRIRGALQPLLKGSDDARDRALRERGPTG